MGAPPSWRAAADDIVMMLPPPRLTMAGRKALM
jgi:hypothetical protein